MSGHNQINQNNPHLTRPLLVTGEIN